MSGPTVGVIVPCYKYADVLEGCVTSVLSQHGVEPRVLIVDDCSPDHTPEVGERVAAGDGRVEYRRHRRNQGLIATANEGLEWARGYDYTVLLSADDLLVPGSLFRATSVMESSPNVGMVYGWATYAHVGRPLPSLKGRWLRTKVWSGPEWIRLRCRAGYNCISSPEVVVRTSAHHAAGEYDPACYHTSDLNMWLRIAAISDIAHIRGIPQAIYRIHSDSMLRSDPSPLLSLRERRAAFDSFFAGAGASLESSDALAATAGRALARQALWRASRSLDRGIRTAEEACLNEELVDFALDVCPQARRLLEWHGLRLRRGLGAGRSRWFFPFLATGAAHRVRGHLGQLRLRTMGI